MILVQSKKNKFDGTTYKIEIDSLFYIYIHETNTNSFLVEFKEWKLFTPKTHLSFIINESLRLTIILSFDKVLNFFSNHPKYEWSKEQKNNLLIRILEYLSQSENSELCMREKYSTIVDFFIQLPTKIDIKESTDCISISYLNEKDSAKTNYTIKETGNCIDLTYNHINSNGYFFFNWNYSKNKCQNEILNECMRYLQILYHKVQTSQTNTLLNGYTRADYYNSFEFEKLDLECDFDKDRFVISFTNKNGNVRTVFKNICFDFGTIVLVDTKKTINELIENLNLGSFTLLDNSGLVHFNCLDQIFIEGWSADDFITVQLQNKKKEIKQIKQDR